MREKSSLLCRSKPDKMIVDDGFQSGGAAVKEGATRDSRDPGKTVGVTLLGRRSTLHSSTHVTAKLGPEDNWSFFRV